MWRYQSVHQRSQTEYLDEVIARLEFDQGLMCRANATLEAIAAQEPILKESLKTPQDPRSHAEGPFMDAHLRRMLIVLYAVVEEKMHLIDIEEFRRMKGYEGEIDELEEMLKEKHAFFESFILVHDASKMHAIMFFSPAGSRGERYGFSSKYVVDPAIDQQQRHEALDRYRLLFDRFKSDHAHLSERDLQQAFYEAHEIRVSYPHHDRMMYAPVQQSLLERVANAHQLSDRDRSMLSEIIGRHLEFEAFHKVDLAMTHWLLHLAKANNYDGDDFLDLVGGCIFLDWVCGSMRTNGGGMFHDAHYLTNVFISEHQLFPERRLEKYEARERKKKEERNRYFQDVGLDGVGLMKLLRMRSGPEFGRVMRTIHQAILGEGEMPKFAPAIEKELGTRATAFYNKLFMKGD